MSALGVQLLTILGLEMDRIEVDYSGLEAGHQIAIDCAKKGLVTRNSQDTHRITLTPRERVPNVQSFLSRCHKLARSGKNLATVNHLILISGAVEPVLGRAAGTTLFDRRVPRPTSTPHPAMYTSPPRAKLPVTR